MRAFKAGNFVAKKIKTAEENDDDDDDSESEDDDDDEDEWLSSDL